MDVSTFTCTHIHAHEGEVEVRKKDRYYVTWYVKASMRSSGSNALQSYHETRYLFNSVLRCFVGFRSFPLYILVVENRGLVDKKLKCLRRLEFSWIFPTSIIPSYVHNFMISVKVLICVQKSVIIPFLQVCIMCDPADRLQRPHPRSTSQHRMGCSVIKQLTGSHSTFISLVEYNKYV